MDPILVILDALTIAPKVAATAADLIRQCTIDGLDPTPEQIAALKGEQADAEADWAKGRPTK